MLPHPVQVLGRHPCQHHKESQGVAPATLRQHVRKLLSVGLPCLPGSLIIIVWGLVHGQFLDLVTQLDSRLHGKSCAGGDPEQERRATHLVDEGVDVFNFPLHGIRLCIRAVASSPAIIVQHREVSCQEWSQLRRRRVHRSLFERATHQDERRSLP